MRLIEGLIATKVAEFFLQQFNEEINPDDVQLQKTRKEFKGDLTLVVFPFLKITKSSPPQTAELLGEALISLSEIDAFNVEKGFLNLEISDAYWVSYFDEIRKEETYGLAEPSGKTVMVEYSSPNTNKPLHLGHIRNNFLGYSVSEVLKANGHNVIKVQVINDRGIHICKSMLSWLKNGDGMDPVSAKIKGDKLVGDFYVAFETELKEQADQLLSNWMNDQETVPSSIRDKVQKLLEHNGPDSKKQLELLARKETDINQEVEEMLLKWENGDAETRALWEQMNSWVYSGWDETYQRMGVDFDKLYYESDTYLSGKKLVEKGLENNLFFSKDDKSVWVDLTEEGLDEKLLLRADGTSVYMTQDLGTAKQRFDDFPELSKLIYTVGNEQNYHFKVLFIVLQKMGFDWAQECEHLSYGMVELPEGKMKTREGTVVDADELMDDMFVEAKKVAAEQGKLDGLSADEKEKTFEIIGMGALKYFILKIDPTRKIMFNPSESIDFNGNTGPFIQYTYTRIRSLLAKAEYTQGTSSLDVNQLLDTERMLIQLIGDFPGVIKESGKLLNPALIANYIYELVKLYNRFYQAVPPIVKESDQSMKEFRLELSNMVGKVIQTGMKLLGIDMPERM